jgi:hypothetical protein
MPSRYSGGICCRIRVTRPSDTRHRGNFAWLAASFLQDFVVSMMTREKPLKPDDFPVDAKENNVVTQHDEPVATTPSREKAEDRRLNEQAAREEEDRWSA